MDATQHTTQHNTTQLMNISSGFNPHEQEWCQQGTSVETACELVVG